jgi:hypothetical protein
MARVLFVGVHAAAAAALSARAGRTAAYDGPDPEEAVLEALEEAGASLPPRATEGEPIVDTDLWLLAEPVGLCLEEARELRVAIERRVAEL